MKLRPYQQKAVPKIVALLQKSRRVVAVSPTGSGKTVIGVSVVLQIARQLGPCTKVLWLAHRQELLNQAVEHIERTNVPKKDIGVWSGHKNYNRDARILVASIQTVQGHLDEIPNVNLIIVDEAHRIQANGYQAVLAARPRAMVLGLTATPERLDGKGLGETFVEMFEVSNPVELHEGGFIAKVESYGLPPEKIRAMVNGVKSQGGDYARSQLGSQMSANILVGDVVRAYEKHGRGEAAIVFAASRAHAQKIVHRFKRGTKRRVGYVDGETPSVEREEILAKLKAGKLDVIVNVDVLTEGFDCDAKCVIDACPTKSLTKYLQRVGRGVRPVKGKVCIHIDHAGNFDRHGHPQNPRHWNLDGRVKDASDPVRKHCPECERVSEVAPGTLACPFCGEGYSEERERRTRELKELKNAELEKRKRADDERAEIRKVLERLARQRGESSKWVERKLAEAVG